MKKVIIFGSTGSIGRNALEVIKKEKSKFKVLGLCVNRDIKTLYHQIKEFHPSYVCVRDEGQAKRLSPKLEKRIKLFKGQKGLDEFSRINSDISVMAISGVSCLKPLFTNIEYTQRIALANKESLVTAGSLVFKKARQFNTEILPVDSEINALFQLIRANGSEARGNNFSKVYLTASGGALAGYKKKDLDKVRVREVLAHPNWKMGKRITVDSATLVNKGFEVIETHFFFGIPYKKIGIVFHKESLVHALVEYKDNTLFACLYPPDMKMPISFALCYPQRSNSGREINFKGKFSYSFAPLCYDNYPLLKIILEAASRGDNALVVLNACDELAIDYFLGKKIKFTDIHKVMRYIFKSYPSHQIRSIDDVFYWDNWSRIKTKEYLERL